MTCAEVGYVHWLRSQAPLAHLGSVHLLPALVGIQEKADHIHVVDPGVLKSSLHGSLGYAVVKTAAISQDLSLARGRDAAFQYG